MDPWSCATCKRNILTSYIIPWHAYLAGIHTCNIRCTAGFAVRAVDSDHALAIHGSVVDDCRVVIREGEAALAGLPEDSRLAPAHRGARLWKRAWK